MYIREVYTYEDVAFGVCTDLRHETQTRYNTGVASFFFKVVVLSVRPPPLTKWLTLLAIAQITYICMENVGTLEVPRLKKGNPAPVPCMAIARGLFSYE